MEEVKSTANSSANPLENEHTDGSSVQGSGKLKGKSLKKSYTPWEKMKTLQNDMIFKEQLEHFINE